MYKIHTHTQTHCPIHYKQSPSSLTLSGNGELATIQGEGRQLSPPAAHTKPLAHTGRQGEGTCIHMFTAGTQTGPTCIACEQSLRMQQAL